MQLHHKNAGWYIDKDRRDNSKLSKGVMRLGRKKAQHLNRVEGHARRTRSFQDEARTADGYNELHGDRIVDLCYDSRLTDDRYVSHGAAFTRVHYRGPLCVL